jgi:hypothetical protein
MDDASHQSSMVAELAAQRNVVGEQLSMRRFVRSKGWIEAAPSADGTWRLKSIR